MAKGKGPWPPEGNPYGHDIMRNLHDIKAEALVREEDYEIQEAGDDGFGHSLVGRRQGIMPDIIAWVINQILKGMPPVSCSRKARATQSKAVHKAIRDRVEPVCRQVEKELTPLFMVLMDERRRKQEEEDAARQASQIASLNKAMVNNAFAALAHAAMSKTSALSAMTSTGTYRLGKGVMTLVSTAKPWNFGNLNQMYIDFEEPSPEEMRRRMSFVRHRWIAIGCRIAVPEIDTGDAREVLLEYAEHHANELGETDGMAALRVMAGVQAFVDRYPDT
jgi:hypothetical protein